MSEVIDCMVWVVQKTCWSMWQFTKFVSLRVADLFGLVFNVLACLTIIRLPCMIRQLQDMDSMAEWRYVGFVQFLIFLIDIPVIIMGLITLALTFGLVLIPFCRKLQNTNVKCDYTHKKGDDIYFGGFKLRRIVVGYFLRLMCDILCLPLGLICLLSWRSAKLVRKIKRKEDKGWEGLTWRKICIVQFLHLLVDLPCILCWLFVMVTWRAPFLIVEVKKERKDSVKWNRYRFEAFHQFGILIADIFFIIMFLFTMFTWRGPFMIYELWNPSDETNDWDVVTEWKYKVIIAKEAGLVFVDIPCILCAIVIFLTLWRIPSFARHCKKDQWKMRRNCVKQFALLLRDFGLFLLNILCVMLGFICLVTLWRAYPLVQDIRKYCKQRAVVGREKDPENGTRVQLKLARKERKSKQLRITWKMRFATFKHFLFLFIDIPAIFVSFVILITVFRFSKLLSKLLQAGSFYMEFALIVYSQFIKLLVDVVFFLLFIILMILRPIQSWVHLLEDEEHRRNRLLRFYMQWVPDILAKRHQMYRDLEETFSTCLKEKKLLRDVRTRMSYVNAEYLKDLQWVRDKVKKHELDDEYGHLMNIIQFYEGKRAYKMARLYSCELNYLQHPYVISHNDNLNKFRNEMMRYEAHVSAAITAVEEFKVANVPLWSEQCGLMTRTRKETQHVLIKCLPSGRFLITLLIIVNLLFIYRGPALIKNLYRRWYDRRRIVFASLREYLKDALTVCIMLLVLVTLYKAPFLLVEVGNDVISKRSWKAVRKTVKRYPPQMGRDFVDFVVTLLSWETIRFFFTAIVFGILMPAHLFLTVMKFLFGKGCCAALTTGILYFIFFGFPFALTYKLAQTLLTNGQDVALVVSIGAFGICLSIFLFLAAALTFRNRENTFSVRPKDYDYVRFNWTNAHVLIFEFVEFLQLLALVFTVSDIPMYGASTLRNASQYLLLNFATFEVKFWMVTALFICWFFVCGLPVILEQVTEAFEEGTFGKQISWTLLVSLFSNTLFVTILESFLSFVACSYNVTCPGGNSTRSAMNATGLATNASIPHCASSVLIDNPRMECWDGEHRGTAVYGLVALVWYATTAIIFGTRYGDSDHPGQDLKFSPIYNVFINIAKAVMVGVVVLAVSNAYLALGSLIAINLGALLFTLLFKRFVGFSLSNSFVLVMWRAVTFVCPIIAAISALVGISMHDINSSVPLAIFLGGTALVILIAIIVSVVRVVKRELTPVEQQRKEVRALLLRLENKLMRETFMVNSWSKYRKQWRRLVRHVYEAQKDRAQLNTRHATFDFPEEIVSRPSYELDGSTPPPIGNPVPALRGGDIDTDDLPPPPPYEDLFPHIMGSSGLSIPPAQSLGGTPTIVSRKDEQSDVSEEAPDDNRPRDEGESAHITSTGSYGDDVQVASPGAIAIHMGDTLWSEREQYDSIQFLENLLDAPPQEPRQSTVLGMECNGKNLLLALEQHIHYSAFSYAFISQLPLWRSVVNSSDWTKLLECVRSLDGSLTGAFNSPTHIDVACADMAAAIIRLEPDPDQEQPPVFVPESRDPEVIRAKSDAERLRFLESVESIENYGEKWAQILEKVLPTIPVYRKCSWDAEDLSFTLNLRRAVRGTITSVGPQGIKMAKGATIHIPKVVKGHFIAGAATISFDHGNEPRGSKGPISVLVNELGILETNAKTYIATQGKRVKFAKALDCLHEVEWK